MDDFYHYYNKWKIQDLKNRHHMIYDEGKINSISQFLDLFYKDHSLKN